MLSISVLYPLQLVYKLFMCQQQCKTNSISNPSNQTIGQPVLSPSNTCYIQHRLSEVGSYPDYNSKILKIKLQKTIKYLLYGLFSMLNPNHNSSLHSAAFDHRVSYKARRILGETRQLKCAEYLINQQQSNFRYTCTSPYPMLTRDMSFFSS